MPDIASWLTRLGLDKYIESFTANEIDFDALRHLSEDDLKELGLTRRPASQGSGGDCRPGR